MSAIQKAEYIIHTLKKQDKKINKIIIEKKQLIKQTEMKNDSLMFQIENFVNEKNKEERKKEIPKLIKQDKKIEEITKRMEQLGVGLGLYDVEEKIGEKERNAFRNWYNKMKETKAETKTNAVRSWDNKMKKDVKERNGEKKKNALRS